LASPPRRSSDLLPRQGRLLVPLVEGQLRLPPVHLDQLGLTRHRLTRHRVGQVTRPGNDDLGRHEGLGPAAATPQRATDPHRTAPMTPIRPPPNRARRAAFVRSVNSVGSTTSSAPDRNPSRTSSTDRYCKPRCPSKPSWAAAIPAATYTHTVRTMSAGTRV